MHSLSNETIDVVIDGTSRSETLRLYARQPNYTGGDWKDARINGFVGNDVLVGGHGDDELFGDAGNDTFQSFYGYNEVLGGSGQDTLDYSWFGNFTTLRITSGVYANLSNGHAYALNSNIRLDDEFSSIENLKGSKLADKLYGNGLANDIFGNGGSDAISGGSGADYIDGGTGRDSLSGGAGDDDLRGGFGADKLSGGTGLDYFLYSSIDDSNTFDGVDFIKDFVINLDTIDLSKIDADTDLFGNQSFDFIGTDFLSGIGGGEVRYFYDRIDDVTVVQADVNGDARADLTIDLAGEIDLFKGDFIL
jgi:serralysin